MLTNPILPSAWASARAREAEQQRQTTSELHFVSMLSICGAPLRRAASIALRTCWPKVNWNFWIRSPGWLLSGWRMTAQRAERRVPGEHPRP